MADAAMKHMASNFAKRDNFKGVDFRRWQKKMHLLSSMSVVYVLTTPILEDGDDNPTMEQVRKRAKWDNAIPDKNITGLFAKLAEKELEQSRIQIVMFGGKGWVVLLLPAVAGPPAWWCAAASLHLVA
ncbi:hypothetical protein Tco_1394910 [Tanacetum coccineum]